MLYPYFRSQWLLMPFHSELLKWYVVNQTAFDLGVWPQWRATKPGTEIHSSLKASVVSSHNSALVASTGSFTRQALFLAFPHGHSFFLLTFLYFSSTNQNATLILKLEGPIRIPSDRTLKLPPPPGTQGFAGGGVCANPAKVPCGNATDGSKVSQQGRVSKASQWISVNVMNI